jgi:hypothetical protein
MSGRRCKEKNYKIVVWLVMVERDRNKPKERTIIQQEKWLNRMGRTAYAAFRVVLIEMI